MQALGYAYRTCVIFLAFVQTKSSLVPHSRRPNRGLIDSLGVRGGGDLAARNVPCIDISRIVAGCASEADIQAVGEACREYGFFNVINHGIPESVIKRFDAAMVRFFGMPMAEKQKVARTATNSRGFAANEFTKRTRDIKELYDYGHTPDRSKPADHPDNHVMDGYNQVPDDDDFAEAVEEYYQACAGVAARLLRCTALALSLPETQFDEYFGGAHTSYLRLNYFPPLPSKATRFVESTADLDRVRDTNDASDDAETGLDALHGPRLGINRHFDAGALTILRQDDHVRGLQMNMRAHQSGGPLWINVDPVPGGLTVNCGDMLQVLSNDEFKAAEHRVLASVPGKVRYSAPFFYNPAYDAVMSPHSPSDPPKYKSFSYGHFRSRRFEGDFEDQGRPEIQIADFSVVGS